MDRDANEQGSHTGRHKRKEGKLCVKYNQPSSWGVMTREGTQAGLKGKSRDLGNIIHSVTSARSDSFFF